MRRLFKQKNLINNATPIKLWTFLNTYSKIETLFKDPNLIPDSWFVFFKNFNSLEHF